MVVTTSQFFNAKILLFGEYSLLYGSMALSIPFDRFYGKLVLPDGPIAGEEKKSNEHINNFLNFLLKLKKEGELAFQLDTERLAEGIKSGLFFQSIIPQGYGLGSSGALIAAIFKTFGDKPEAEQFNSIIELLKLKSFFASLESFFHGKSSGLDPMISFLNKALLILGNDKLETFNADFSSDSGKGGVFLIDSGEPGETQPLVKHFKRMYEDQKFKRVFEDNFIPVVNDSIRSYTSGDTLALLENLKKLSGFQMHEFAKMIPNSVKEIWQTGLESNRYYLKLCGSGGGGMMLGFTDNIEQVQMELIHKSPIVIHRF